MGFIENRDAQFVLLAGFIIAVGLVITTLLLNSIAFEGNMAVDAGSSPIKYDIANLMRITADEMKSAYRSANGTNNSMNITNFSRQMRNFSGNVSKIYALRGEGVNVTWNVSNWNSSRYANFTDNGTASGASNWIVIENVQNVSVFKLTNINRTAGNFMVYVSNQATGAFIWSIQLNDTTSPPKNVIITKTSGGTNSKGFDFGDYTSIDLLRSLSPSDYNFINNVAGNNYKIEFRNGTDASGSFYINGTASGRNFTRARDYILNATLTFSTSRVRANITIPVSVPW